MNTSVYINVCVSYFGNIKSKMKYFFQILFQMCI